MVLKKTKILITSFLKFLKIKTKLRISILGILFIQILEFSLHYRIHFKFITSKKLARVNTTFVTMQDILVLLTAFLFLSSKISELNKLRIEVILHRLKTQVSS